MGTCLRDGVAGVIMWGGAMMMACSRRRGVNGLSSLSLVLSNAGCG